MAKIEQRIFSGVQLRASSKEAFALEGVAAAYNTFSNNLGGFRETIKPGAFARALREKQDVKALFNHDANYVLGRVKNGSLVLTDTPEGLAFRCQLIRGHSMHEQIYAMVQRGDISECSFAFVPAPKGQQWSADRTQRTLTDVDLFDVSVVCYPAYPTGTSAHARSQQQAVRSAGRYVLTQDWRARAQARLDELAPVIARDKQLIADEERRAGILRSMKARLDYEESLAEARAKGYDV